MANVIKQCRVCGNNYEACRSNRRSVGVFRWQEVACSPECGAIYLQRINESRGLIEQPEPDDGEMVVEDTDDKESLIEETNEESEKENKTFFGWGRF